MIRRANAADVDRLVEMGCRFIAETGYRGLMVANPEALRILAEGLLANPAGAIFVAEHAEGVDGMLGLVVYDHPMSGERTATEMFWWMEPSARGTAGMHLLDAAKTWAVEHGAIQLQMVAPTPAVSALYERLGFRYVESTYTGSLTS